MANNNTMATTTIKKRSIRYLNRDFTSFQQALVQHLKIYFPNNYQDFNESSIGMMMTELASFIGDNISFYMDKQFDENFIETAKQPKNIFKHARQLGFKAFGKTSAIGTIDGFIQVPASGSSGLILPDMRYAGKIRRGAQCKSTSGDTYETLLDADFSTVDITNPSYLQVGTKDSKTGQPLTFALRLADSNAIPIKAGQTKTTTISVGTYQPFLKITLPDIDVLEVLNVSDSQGNTWYEVDYLAQDTVFDGIANTGNDATQVPYVLQLRSVPYRFITQFDITTSRTSLIFGTGDAQHFDGELIPDLGELSLPLYGKNQFTDFSIDPQNFLKTRTMGLAPVNVNLIITYRVGGGLNTNAGAQQINTVTNSIFDIGDSTLNQSVVRDVGNSFSVLNQGPIQGGQDELDIDVIKALISAYFAAQARVVTIEDFIVRTMSMPSRFGAVFRVTANVSPINTLAIELVVLSQDVNDFVTVCPDTLKQNIKTYLSRFRMMTDAIEILDGDIIDVGLNFQVLTNPDFAKADVLTRCLNVLQDFFNINKWQLAQPINLSVVHNLLMTIPGVLSVPLLQIVNIVGNFDGRAYSNTSYSISQNTVNNIVYCPKNSIFEFKYPNKDIYGVAK